MNKTEDAICNAMLDLMEEQPLRTIKVTKLAERAGISRSTFYLYFNSIEEVVERIEENYFNAIPVESLPGSYTLDEAEWRRYHSKMAGVLRTFEILTGPNGDPAFRAKLEERDRQTLERSSTAQFRSAHSIQLELVHEFIHGGKMSATRWWAQHKDEISVNEFSSMIFRLIQACTKLVRR